MNFGTTRLVALLLLIVAVGACDWGGEFVGSVKLIDREHRRTIGAINFWQPKACRKDVFLYGNIWDIPDGTYIAVVHKCDYGIYNTCKIGPARAQINQVGDVTNGRQPMTLFRREFNKSMRPLFVGIAKGVSLDSQAEDKITASFVAIYRDTPAGMKLCSESQNNTAKYFASGYVTSTPIGSTMPNIPMRHDV